MTTNPTVLNWVEEIKSLVKPEKEVWIDGSKEQIEELRQLAAESGVIKPLNPEKLPGCAIHRTSALDAARTEKRTFICCDKKEEAGPTNNWKNPDEAYFELSRLFEGVMENRTMYIIPFCLGVPDSPLFRAGVKITDSIYVALNTVMLARTGKIAVDYLDALCTPVSLGATEEAESAEVSQTAETFDSSKSDDNPELLKTPYYARGSRANDWFKGLHSVGAPQHDGKDNRYICHFPEDNSVWAINTSYSAAAFLSKKAVALRLMSRRAKREGWLAEHMAIIEVRDSDGDVTYIAAAFPSGTGKTSLAMMNLPEVYKQRGYQVRCISEDIAWLKKGADGRLYATNPEIGVFGMLPSVNAESNPNVIATAQKNAIFTNVAHLLDDNTVWWEGMNDEEISNAIDWRGEPWDNIDDESPEDSANSIEGDVDTDAVSRDDLKKADSGDNDDNDEEEGDEIETTSRTTVSIYNQPYVKRGAHSNSRFTAPIENCPCLSPEFNSPEGVPISAIIFGGRRTKAIPLVYQSFDWVHGVFMGSVLGTESAKLVKPSAIVVRRDPMAMLRYCGYNMADYWRHWLKMGKRLGRNAPKIFNVNWFKIGADNKAVWPGFGENIRVLDWIIRRISEKPGREKCGIIESPVGYMPKAEDIDITGLESEEFGIQTVESLLYIDKTVWKEDVNGIKQLYAKFGDKLPDELKEQLVDLEKRLLNA
ncbi:MAG: phosphoenolpyruvate carboxykinase (GTP) [Oscillospiraceae bacterium]|nr:phosphoenolpyruvate carboxykinase (GTP) [Oscillospiraceae bacterium]